MALTTQRRRRSRSGEPDGDGGARTDGARGDGRRTPWTTWAKRIVAGALVVLAGIAAYHRRTDVVLAARMLGHIRPGWLAVAAFLEMGSMIVFARLQRWLLRCGGVRIAMRDMVEITLAGNAMGTSLPGGAAWAATWAYGQLRRRGADRTLSGWVILVAGALGSFALFLLFAAGVWIAGARGPVSHLRWGVAALAAIPPVAGGLALGANRWAPVRRALRGAWSGVRASVPGAPSVGRAVGTVVEKLQTVRPGVRGWSEALGLAVANWVDDALCLMACILALGVHVPWRGLIVVYTLTQISASLPITPGGLGVVEGSMTALLTAYGVRAHHALAIVLLYRVVSFWGLVPIGWATWGWLETAQRRGRRQRPHPWAPHRHEPSEVPFPVARALGPERVWRPAACPGCRAGDPAAERPRSSVI